MTDYKFEGWMGEKENAIGNMVWKEFQPKTWDERDVDIKITHCGVCGSEPAHPKEWLGKSGLLVHCTSSYYLFGSSLYTSS